MRRFGVFQLWMSGCLQLEKRFPEIGSLVKPSYWNCDTVAQRKESAARLRGCDDLSLRVFDLHIHCFH